MLNVMAGRSEKDERTWDIPFDPMPDFSLLQRYNLSGIAVGLPRNAFSSVDPAVTAAFEAAVKKFGTLGAQVIDDTNFESAEEFRKLDKATKTLSSPRNSSQTLVLT